MATLDLYRGPPILGNCHTTGMCDTCSLVKGEIEKMEHEVKFQKRVCGVYPTIHVFA